MMRFLFLPLVVLAAAAYAAPPVAPDAAESAATGAFFDSAGVRIHYAQAGEHHPGPPIVLIHGYADSLEWAWQDTGVVQTLANEFHVIALDCRGHGRSDKPHEPGAYGVEMVEDVARLLDHLEIERAHIVGYSMGGRIALKFAATRSDRVQTLTLIGASGTIKATEIEIVERTAEALERGDGISPLVERLWPREDETISRAEEVARTNEPVMAELDAPALLRVAREFPGLVVPERDVRSLSMPVLAICGDQDPLLPATQALNGCVPRLRTAILTGANHIDVVRRPEVPDLVVEFAGEYADGVHLPARRSR